MGCGKSSVGRRLSQLLCCPFMDLDQVIEERAGRSIPEIFASEGEEAFRAMELETLKEIVGLPMYSRGYILALGGGAVMTTECAEIVHSDTICIYLKASMDTLMEHLSGQTDNRPLLSQKHSLNEISTRHCEESEGRRGNLELETRIKELMALRSDTYEKTAHIIIDTDGKSIEAVASEIINIIREELV